MILRAASNVAARSAARPVAAIAESEPLVASSTTGRSRLSSAVAKAASPARRSGIVITNAPGRSGLAGAGMVLPAHFNSALGQGPGYESSHRDPHDRRDSSTGRRSGVSYPLLRVDHPSPHA